MYLHEVEHGPIIVEDIRQSYLPFSQNVNLVFTEELAAGKVRHVSIKGIKPTNKKSHVHLISHTCKFSSISFDCSKILITINFLILDIMHYLV